MLEPVGVNFGYPIAAVPMNTPREPAGPWVLPGKYTVTLAVNGKRYSQPLTVRMDPRVRTPALALLRQHSLSVRMVQGLKKTTAALEEFKALRTKVGMRAQREVSWPVGFSIRVAISAAIKADPLALICRLVAFAKLCIN